MPSTHLSLHCHIVFSTKDRIPVTPDPMPNVIRLHFVRDEALAV